MAKTNVYMDWKDVTVTPQGASAIPLTQVTSIEWVDTDSLESWQADGHKFATVVVAADGKRGCTIHGGDAAAFRSIPRGVPCTVVARLYDARNRVGEGALTYTLANAVVETTPTSGNQRKYAGASVSFAAYSADGDTDPLAITQAGA